MDDGWISLQTTPISTYFGYLLFPLPLFHFAACCFITHPPFDSRFPPCCWLSWWTGFESETIVCVRSTPAWAAALLGVFCRHHFLWFWFGLFPPLPWLIFLAFLPSHHRLGGRSFGFGSAGLVVVEPRVFGFYILAV